MDQDPGQNQAYQERLLPNRIEISIIVPVYNNPQDLEDCLSALLNTSGPDSELIVVDDGSTDNTASVGERMGVKLLRLAENSGVAAARNYGASQARGEILFFVDADVVVARGTVERIVKVMQENQNLAAVFGSYDAQPRARGLVSQYRNLLHHFVHQNSNPEASTFWAGCGAIRRPVFQKMAGFDAKRFRHPSIEDIELGYRLRLAGHRILLDKDLQVTHLKRWNLCSTIRTDVVCRAIPWSRLILETNKLPDDLNLKYKQRLSGSLVMVAALIAPIGLVRPELFLVSTFALLAVLILNRELYSFFFRRRGLIFAVGCVPLHLLYYLCSVLSYVYVWTGLRIKDWAIALERGLSRNGGS